MALNGDRKSVGDGTASLSQAHLLNTVIAKLGLRNDRALALRIDVVPSTLCKIRHDRTPVPSWLLIDFHEETDIPIKELRRLAGDLRPHTGKSAGPLQWTKSTRRARQAN